MGIEEDDVNMLDDENSGGDNNPSADQERRIRREIANSNERRRMQSINAGFQSLRTLLPHHEGEKLSKAAILQQTSEYIYSLEQEKTRLLQQNSQLKRLLALNQQRLDGDETSPQLKKKRIHNENDTIRSTEEESTLSSKVNDLNLQLTQEQRIRLQLEETVRSLEAQITICSKPTSVIQGQTIIKQEEDSCRLVLSQDLSARPPAAILLSSVTEPVPLKPEPSTMIVSVEKLSNLTGPLPQPAAVAAVATVPTLKKASPPITLAKAPPLQTPSSTSCERTLPQELTDSSNTSRSYILSTSSRNNLDSIVEAIRHLEGDHLFSEEQQGIKEEVVEFSTSHSKIAINSFPIPESSSSGIFIMNKN